MTKGLIMFFVCLVSVTIFSCVRRTDVSSTRNSDSVYAADSLGFSCIPMLGSDFSLKHAYRPDHEFVISVNDNRSVYTRCFSNYETDSIFSHLIGTPLDDFLTQIDCQGLDSAYTTRRFFIPLQLLPCDEFRHLVIKNDSIYAVRGVVFGRQ